MARTDEFGRRKKIKRNVYILRNSPTKISENFFAYACISEHSEKFRFFLSKKTNTDKGFAPPPPPPLADIPAKNVFFL